MATPDEGRKRMWRFRLNDATALEVSSPPRATEKQVRRRGRVSLVLGTLLAALTLVAVAAADQIDADADALSTSTPQGNSAAANQQPGTTVEYDLSASIDETGNATDDVFKNAGDTVDVTITRSGAWLASPAGSPASFSFTAYGVNQAGKIGITVPCGTSAGAMEEMSAVLTAVASNGKRLSENPVTLTWTITSQGADAASCTPANTVPTVTANDQSFNEGSSTNYSAGWTDPDAGQSHTCTIDFGDGSGPQSGTISPAQPSTSGTCSASHTYADGPNSYTIDVAVSDGTAAGSDTATATVNNVPPTVVAGFTAASVNCQTTASLSIDPDDVGVNDSPWKVNIDWGDGSTEPEITRTNLSSFSVSHVYALPGSYNAQVTVKDKDNDTGSDLVNAITINQTYTVDFLPPFDDSTPSGLIVNKMKNGRVVPVKATIYDDCTRAFVTDPGSTVSIKVSKTSGSGGTPDPVEEYADAGQSSAGTNLFRWSTDGFWIYNLDSKALGLTVDNAYRVDIYVGAVKATATNWAVLQPIK